MARAGELPTPAVRECYFQMPGAAKPRPGSFCTHRRGDTVGAVTKARGRRTSDSDSRPRTRERSSLVVRFSSEVSGPMSFSCGRYILLAYLIARSSPSGRDGAYIHPLIHAPRMRKRKAGSRSGRRGTGTGASPNRMGIWASCIRGGLPWISFLYVFFLSSL